MYVSGIRAMEHDSICKEYADTDAVPHYHFDIGLLHMQSIRWGIPLVG